MAAGWLVPGDELAPQRTPEARPPTGTTVLQRATDRLPSSQEIKGLNDERV